VNSVLNQTIEDIEIIVCDDCSTDGTLDEIKKIDDDRVKVLLNATNQGEGRARDRAIMEASAPWVAFIDADDAWLPHRLESLLSEAPLPDSREILFDDILICDDKNGELVPWRPMRSEKAFCAKKKESIKVPFESYLCSERLLIKPMIPTELIKNNRISHSTRKFGADTEYMINLIAKGGTLRYIPLPLYLYRITPTSVTSKSLDREAMRKCIEDCYNNLTWREHTKSAFIKKIEMLRTNETLYEILDKTKSGHLAAAAKTLLSDRSALMAFPRHGIRILAYHTHRILSGGTGRTARKEVK